MLGSQAEAASQAGQAVLQLGQVACADNQASLNSPRPCPSCGHCPTCGRGGYQWFWPAAYPYQPNYPYWNQQGVIWVNNPNQQLQNNPTVTW